MPQFDRHFTLSEANALIPWVRSIFQKVDRILRDVAQNPEPSPGQALIAPTEKPAHTNGKQSRQSVGANVIEIGHLWAGLTTDEKANLVNGLLGALQDEGIVIQDVHRGLIDFPAWRDGEEILLCYEMADGSRITHWHHIADGYAGRQPVDDLIQP